MTATKVTSGLINFSTGKVLQNVYAESSAASTGTTAVVNDDTIPQKTEGNEVITLAITPVSATSRLIITGVLNLYNTAATYRIWALFKDDGADAIWADVNYDAVGVPKDHLVHFSEISGSTSARTYKVRAGALSGTMTINGVSGSRNLGAIPKTNLQITEIEVG